MEEILTAKDKHEYKIPDLKAPRFRPKRLQFDNSDFYKRFLNDNPKFSNVPVSTIKNIIFCFNGKIWENVINERDGIELPEQLGFLFIGTCQRKKSNVDFYKSAVYNRKLQNQNWESDQYLAKIFYTNYETKYRFKNNDLWGFVGVRKFKRSVGQTYPKEWKKYLVVDNLIKISRLFRKQSYKHYKQKLNQKLFVEYDEFDLDNPYGKNKNIRHNIKNQKPS